MKTPPRFDVNASIALFCAITLWGSVPLFLRSFIDEIDGWTANGFRYPFAMLLWIAPLIYFAWRGQVPKRLYALALAPSLVNILNQTFWGWTPYFAEPGMIIFLGRCSLLFSVILSFIVFHDERALIRSPRFWIGLALCVTGFVGLNLLGDEFSSKTTGFGVLIIVAHALFASLYSITVRHYTRGIPPWISFPVICAYTSIGMIILMMLFGEPSRLLDLSTDRWVLLMISSIIGIALAHVCFYAAIAGLGVSISSGCILLMPFYTAAMSYWIYGERFTPAQWASGIFILLGAGVLLFAQQHLGREREPIPVHEGAPELEDQPGDGSEE